MNTNKGQKRLIQNLTKSALDRFIILRNVKEMLEEHSKITLSNDNREL